jgi:hypothetical protein
MSGDRAVVAFAAGAAPRAAILTAPSGFDHRHGPAAISMIEVVNPDAAKRQAG